MPDPGALPISNLALDLEKDLFLRMMLRELCGTLETIIGVEEASGFISVVSQRVSEEIDSCYKRALCLDKLSREQVVQVIVDFKRRIEGDFYVIEETEDRIVLGNRKCPFGDKAADRPSLCQMTSNIFGSIAADNLGYAKVELRDTIAKGAPECEIVIYLRPSDASELAPGREFIGR